MPTIDGAREFQEGPKRREARKYLRDVRRGSVVMNVVTGEKAVATRSVYRDAPYLRVRVAHDFGAFRGVDVEEDWTILNIAIMRHPRRTNMTRKK